MMRATISAKYLLAVQPAKRESFPMSPNATVTIYKAKVANGARKSKAGCIAGNLPSHAMGATYHGSKAARSFALTMAGR